MDSEPKTHYPPQKRAGHVTAVVGKFLFLWGGFSDETHSSTLYESKYLPPGQMWVYHSDTNHWISGTCNGHPPPGLAGASAVIVNGGLYIVFGHSGRLGRMNSIWKMDLMTRTWEEVVPKMENMRPSQRDKGTAWAHNNKIYWFGGYGSPPHGYLHEHGSFTIDSSAHIPSPSGSNKCHWHAYLHPSLPRHSPGVLHYRFLSRNLVCLQLQSEWWNNQLLEFDIDEKVWTDVKCTGDIPSPRAAHAADKFENSSDVYLFGGRHKATRLNDIYHFNHYTNNWTRLHTEGPEPEGRSWHTFSAIPPKHFLLVGGYTTDFQPLADAWVLDVELCQWTEIASPLDKPRLWHTASTTCDDEVMVFGGCCNNIMDETIDTEYSNELVIFRIAPKTLVRLCLDAAFNYRTILQEAWDNLPRHLSKVLTMRLEGFSTDLLVKTHHQAKRQGRSCVIS